MDFRAYFGHFSLAKSAKNKIAFLQRKECSNKKIEENKSGLEFNCLLKSKCASLNFDFSPSPTAQACCHRKGPSYVPNRRQTHDDMVCGNYWWGHKVILLIANSAVPRRPWSPYGCSSPSSLRAFARCLSCHGGPPWPSLVVVCYLHQMVIFNLHVDYDDAYIKSLRWSCNLIWKWWLASSGHSFEDSGEELIEMH